MQPALLMILTFNAAQFWVTFALATVPATIVTRVVQQRYAHRARALRFGRAGTAAMLALVWAAVFIPVGRLCLYAWT